MLRKANSYSISNDGLIIKDRIIVNKLKEEVSNKSENLSIEEPHIYFYMHTISSKEKTYKKLKKMYHLLKNSQLLIVVAVTEPIPIPSLWPII